MLEYLNSDLPMPELSLLVDFAPQMGRELPSFLLSDLAAMECTAQISPWRFVVSYECEPPEYRTYMATAMFTLQAKDILFWEVPSQCSVKWED